MTTSTILGTSKPIGGLVKYFLLLIAAPLFARHRANPNVQGFAKGAYAAAIGMILGACILLEKIAIGDWPTILIGVVSLAVLFRWKVSNSLLIAATAIAGLITSPLLQPIWRWPNSEFNALDLGGVLIDRWRSE